MSAMIAQTGLLISRNNMDVATASGVVLAKDGRIDAVVRRPAFSALAILLVAAVLLTLCKVMLVLALGDAGYEAARVALQEGTSFDRLAAWLMSIDGPTNGFLSLIR